MKPKVFSGSDKYALDQTQHEAVTETICTMGKEGSQVTCPEEELVCLAQLGQQTSDFCDTLLLKSFILEEIHCSRETLCKPGCMSGFGQSRSSNVDPKLM